MDKKAALRRVEPRLAPGFQVEAVAGKIGEPAGVEGIHARRTEVQLAPVQAAHGLLADALLREYGIRMK